MERERVEALYCNSSLTRFYIFSMSKEAKIANFQCTSTMIGIYDRWTLPFYFFRYVSVTGGRHDCIARK